MKTTIKALDNYYQRLDRHDALLVLGLVFALVALILWGASVMLVTAFVTTAICMALDYHYRSWTYKNKQIEEELKNILRNQR
jgi:hypothetical protein